MRNKFYNQFGHYTALSCDNNSKQDVMLVYKKMQENGIHVPEDYVERCNRIGSNFKFDFFISKTKSVIKWVPTRSADKKAKFTYMPASWFIEKLEGSSPVDALLDEVESKHCYLDDQLQFIGDVILLNRVITSSKSIVMTANASDDGQIKSITRSIPVYHDRFKEEEDTSPF